MLFFDSYAILEIIKGNENYRQYSDKTFIINTLILSEVFYALLRETNLDTATEIIKKMNFEFLEIDKDIAIESARFRFENKNKKLSYADCIGYITSLRHHLKFLTGDKEFKDLDHVEFVRK